MFGNHFYHETIRRAVSVFGTLFNNISIVRKDSNGDVKNIVKVPLAYGPKQKFLSRIEEQASLTDPKVAIKLPRMSFEITSLTYDTNTKMQKGMRQVINNGVGQTGDKKTVLGPVGYRMGLQLNIMAKNQDDALQIIEQIIPFFQPDYAVTVKQVEDNFKTDMPFILQSISMNDDYEGDYITRRAIIYTLDFETRVRFYGEVSDNKVIRKVTTDIRNKNDGLLQERQLVILNPFLSAESDNYQVDVVQSFGNTPDEVILTVVDGSQFTVGDIIVGSNTTSIGQIKSVVGNDLTVYKPDNIFEVGENVIIQNEVINSEITNQQEVWY